jgi:hypothetical protein
LAPVLLLGALLAAGAARAQDDGGADGGGGGGVETLDASLPDASVGGGGADRDEPDEGDGRLVIFCRLNRDCDRGFNCLNGRCTWSGYRDATNGGCSGAPGIFGLGLGALAWRIRRKPPRSP